MALSVQQQAVIDWVTGGKGSLELVARAGCGKTFTLMAAIDAIAEHKLGDVALMAYNKSIATELKNRLVAKKIDWKVAQAGTVHSFGFAAWRKVAPKVEVDENKSYTIIDSMVDKAAHKCVYRDAAPLIAKVVAHAKGRAFGHLINQCSREAWLDIWEHFGLDEELADAGPHSQSDVLRAACKVFKRSLELCSEVIDFDDMILAPLVFKARFWPKDWILVDESQDTNPARRALALAMLKPRTGRMIFVGDDRQAIYGFTGADSDSMAQLKHVTSATTLPLNVTYRCPKSVVQLAQSIVADITAHDSAPQGVVRAIEYNDLFDSALTKADAILCRNTAPLINCAYALISAGTPCRVEGREIGTGLIKLARRWKVSALDKLLDKLEEYEARETAKLMSQDKESAVEGLQDKLACLRLMIERVTRKGLHSVNDLVAEITTMFGDVKEGQVADVLMLGTIHRSKGREWPRVFILGRTRFLPSPYAKKEWQQVQEQNLEYVAITRAQQELIDVDMPKEGEG